MTIDEANHMPVAAFLARFGFLFEHSPWVVAEAARLRPFADWTAMHQAMTGIVAAAGAERQLALLRAHPQLADKEAMAAGLTRESAEEQKGAGLDRLSADEFARFQTLNAAYRQRFGFPFVICVRLSDKDGILAAMAARLTLSAAEEQATALAEVGKIVWLRLSDLIRAAA
jgi:2-oxo-4-hydroxy-4-carboxy-5-ureidoimidazoline decarboxylase